MLERVFRWVDRHRVVAISTLNSIVLFATILIAVLGPDRGGSASVHAEGEPEAQPRDEAPPAAGNPVAAPASRGDARSPAARIDTRAQPRAAAGSVSQPVQRKVTVTRRRSGDK